MFSNLIAFAFSLKFIIRLTFTWMYSNIYPFSFNSLLIKIDYLETSILAVSPHVDVVDIATTITSLKAQIH